MLSKFTIQDVANMPACEVVIHDLLGHGNTPSKEELGTHLTPEVYKNWSTEEILWVLGRIDGDNFRSIIVDIAKYASGLANETPAPEGSATAEFAADAADDAQAASNPQTNIIGAAAAACDAVDTASYSVAANTPREQGFSVRTKARDRIRAELMELLTNAN